jgi:hypothetical protein
MGVVGALALTLPTSGETLYADYLSELRMHADDPQVVVAEMDRRLAEIAETDRKRRTVQRWAAVGLAAAGAAGIVLSTSDHEHTSSGVYGLYASGLILIASGSLFGQSFIPTARERMWSLWSQDPGLTQRVLMPTIVPVNGGGAVGLSGTF